MNQTEYKATAAADTFTYASVVVVFQETRDDCCHTRLFHNSTLLAAMEGAAGLLWDSPDYDDEIFTVVAIYTADSPVTLFDAP